MAKFTVVTEDTPPPARRKPATIKAAAERSERELLVAMRDTAASVLDAGGVPAHALAGIMRQIRDFDKDIRAIDLRAVEEAKESAPSPDEAWDAEAL